MRMLMLLFTTSALVAPAHAETLSDAVAAAYSNNPQIAAARAQVRQIDENFVQAAALTRPNLNVQGSFSQDLFENFTDAGRFWQARATLLQPVWQGGRIRAEKAAALARVEAARANLAAIEQQIIAQTVGAYADVLRTAEIVKLNENNVRVLEQQLRASRDRFEVGDVTLTDVAQSEARLAAAKANLDGAAGQAVVAVETYRQLTGLAPRALAPLPPLPAMPVSADEATERATSINPDLVAARLNEVAAGREANAIKRQRGPNLGVQFNAQYTRLEGGPVFLGFSGFNPSIGAQLTVPLFTGGRIASQARQAQARQSEQLELITLTERQVRAAATGNYAQFGAASAVIRSARVQVSANALAAEGVRQENQVGSRDILDVLNAEQELLNSRVQLVQAERDQYVLAYQLLTAMGQADVALAGAPVERYDPAANLARVRAKSWGEFAFDPDPAGDRDRNRAPLVGPTAGATPLPDAAPGPQ